MWYKKKEKSKLDKLPIPGNCKVAKKVDYKAKLDRVFSLYIRLRDGFSNGTFVCVSCGQIKPISEADCGHYINRKHMSTRFSEVNCNAQCRKCNRFDEGNIQGYRRGLIRKYGEQRVLLLEAEKGTTRQYSDFEYKVLIKHYTEEIKKLRKEKVI